MFYSISLPSCKISYLITERSAELSFGFQSITEHMLKKELRGLAVGVTLKEGKFLALVLKVKFEDHSIETFIWARDKIKYLAQALFEYSNYLQEKGIETDGDAVEQCIKDYAPPFSQEDVEKVQANSVVEKLSGFVNKNHSITLTIKLNNIENEHALVITPNYLEWVIGYVFNTLNEFDEDGDPILPTGSPH